MNNKMSIERIADRMDILAGIVPDKSKPSLERVADGLDTLVGTTSDKSKASIERVADAIEKYEGGGGGSADLSIATITIKGAVSVTAAQIMTVEAGAPFDCLFVIEDQVFENTTIDTALYKGRGVILASPSIIAGSITVSGDIEELGNNLYAITGDCTITARGAY